MDRFNLILKSLPDDPPLDLWDELRELGWTVRPLPCVLLSGLSDSEAKIIKTDLQILGAELEIVDAPIEPKPEVKEKPPVKEISDDEISFEELTLEIGNAPADFQLPPAESEKAADEVPLWELSLEEGSAASTPPPAPTSIPVVNKPQASEISTLSFSLEDDHTPTPPPPPVSKPPEKEIASHSFSLDEDHTPAPPAPPIAAGTPVPVKVESAPAPIEVTAQTAIIEPEKVPELKGASETTQDSSAEVEAIDEDGDDWLDVDEDEDADEKPAGPPAKKRSILLGGGLLLVALLAAYIYMPTDPVPPEGSNDGSTLVTSLLGEQERIAKEERKQALASMKKTVEVASEVIVGKFPIKLSDGALNGEIHFGRYQAGLLVDSLKIVEEKQQKLSPQDLAAGKTPRPWLKSFEVELPPVSAREPLGAKYHLLAETRAYVEDSSGTLRVPCMLELDCEFKAGANLSCFYEIKNKTLYKKPAEQKETVSSQNTPIPEPSSRKTQLTIEREDALGFLVLISGDFAAKLNPP